MRTKHEKHADYSRKERVRKRGETERRDGRFLCVCECVCVMRGDAWSTVVNHLSYIGYRPIDLARIGMYCGRAVTSKHTCFKGCNGTNGLISFRGRPKLPARTACVGQCSGCR